MVQRQLVIVRGGGDLATGVVQKLYRAGFPVLVLEAPAPTAIRRSVALCEAVYDGAASVEDMACRLVADDDEITACHRQGIIPLMVDESGDAIGRLAPCAVVDAILAKRNLGTHRGMAPITIGLGPGFTAGEDVDVVVETMRGHNLGRLIFSGAALPNTGIPGLIAGESGRRVIRAPADGVIHNLKRLGDVVQQGDALLEVAGQAATAPFTGLLRGLIREGLTVCRGMKVGDIDPRCDVDWHTISDKARCLGGAVLEALMMLDRREQY